MNQSVIKALKLLDLFTEEDQELTLKEISYRANMPKPTAYRLLSALESCNFLHKTKETEHDSRYRLGLKLLELGQIVSDQLELRGIALPFMEELAHEINEVIHLVIVNQNEATYIEKVESTRALRLYTRIGKSTPLYMGSGPKLLLAFLDEKRKEKILDREELHFLGDHEPTDRKSLLEELEKIREAGYSYSIGEQDADTTGISYPIYDHRGYVVAALTVSGLSSHFEGDNLSYIKASTERTAQDISEKLGYRGRGFVR
ncbi:helix-turn-helix domain-containing protein [Virgibacillus dakarensis]|uniref:IclR family transcriptional regulator n=1 Tax=Lentibacillus populi TaxID=1827502 RepID=A0A9W5X6E6_9BACI|nr:MULTISPECIES: IclR family transcriptional regulator [Bacillaceae]MBT2218301.1 IclR family transcriptional regulator [Virgibacillus dakarensis]MTW87853.1 helix-turn-helix domain-containing protein [Virgibacillus dakarensis]GGB50549.1 IclR family transcriptional regulator [Lentibacillus populi]